MVGRAFHRDQRVEFAFRAQSQVGQRIERRSPQETAFVRSKPRERALKTSSHAGHCATQVPSGSLTLCVERDCLNIVNGNPIRTNNAFNTPNSGVMPSSPLLLRLQADFCACVWRKKGVILRSQAEL